MVKDGDKKATLIFEAMAYQIAKDIGAMVVVLKGQIDGIIITGGLAHSVTLTNWIKERIGFLALVFVFPARMKWRLLPKAASGFCGTKKKSKYMDRGIKNNCTSIFEGA